MIKHVVAFRFKDGISDEQKQKLLEEYNGFPIKFPEMRNFSIGKNISQRDNTFEYAFSVEFDDEAALKRYLSSAEHEDHVINRFRPAIHARAIVSYEVR